MKNLTTLLIVAIVAIIAAGSAHAFNFSINGTTIVVDPAEGECSLYAFSTTYHYNHDVTGRNEDYPGFEYQYEGEQVDFWATLQDFSQYQLMNMNPEVVANCVGGTYTIPLMRTSDPSFQNGLYQAQFHGMWNIPPLPESGNCQLVLVVNGPPNAAPLCVDPLTNGMYTNVNDVLVNPQVQFTASSPFAFVPTIYNAYNPSIPLWVDYQLQSMIDREGDGVIGDLWVRVPRLRGTDPNGRLIWDNETGDIIPASNIRFHKNYDFPGVYTNLDDTGHPMYGEALVMQDVATQGFFGMSEPIRLFWELYYSQLFNAPGGYVSDPSWNNGNILFEYIIV